MTPNQTLELTWLGVSGFMACLSWLLQSYLAGVYSHVAQLGRSVSRVRVDSTVVCHCVPEDISGRDSRGYHSHFHFVGFLRHHASLCPAGVVTRRTEARVWSWRSLWVTSVWTRDFQFGHRTTCWSEPGGAL